MLFQILTEINIFCFDFRVWAIDFWDDHTISILVDGVVEKTISHSTESRCGGSWYLEEDRNIVDKWWGGNK